MEESAIPGSRMRATTKHGTLTVDEIAAMQPGMARLMDELSRRYWVLYYAAKAGNWELAAYMERESEKILQTASVSRPKYRDDIASFVRERLGVREIDLYQVHWPDPWGQVPLRETMKALEALHRAGKIRHIGVSNFAVRDLEEARAYLSRAEIASNQVRYNMLQREVEAEVVPYCGREGIGILAWSPIGKGVLSGKYHDGKRPKDRVRAEEDLFKPANLRATAPLIRELRKIGKAHRKMPAQVALAWLRRHSHVIPIPGAKRSSQSEENVGGAGWSLDAREIRALGATLARLRLNTF